MTIAKICLGPGNHCCLVDPGPFTLQTADRVVIENEGGLKLGRVKGVYPDPEMQFTGRLKSLVRLATPEDLAQEVFLSIWKSALTYRPDAKFTTWPYC